MAARKQDKEAKQAKSKGRRRWLTTTIKASLWARGGKRGNARSEYDEGTRLVNDEDGTMCCLGFDAVQRGVPLKKIGTSSVPSEVGDKRLTAWSKMGVDEEGERGDWLEDLAVDVNDETSTTDDEKIKKLRPIFAQCSPPRKILWLPNR